MACCKVSPREDEILLVKPPRVLSSPYPPDNVHLESFFDFVDRTVSPSPPEDVHQESFADVVDRTLAHVREVLVSEHAQQLQRERSIPILPPSKPFCDIVLESQQPARESQQSAREGQQAVPAQVPPSAHAVTARFTECGTQTQVDWDWPLMLSPCKDLDEKPTPAMSKNLDHAQVHDHSNLPMGEQQSMTTKSIQNLRTGEESLATKSSNSKNSANKARAFMSMTSDLMNDRKQHRQAVFGEILMSSMPAWKRILIRSRKAPWEVMDAAMSIVIMANAVAIGVRCDTKDWETGWLVVDSIFASIFTFELLVKMFCFGLNGYFCHDHYYWAWFETALVLLSLFEIASEILVTDPSSLDGSDLIRVIRLLRLVKILRVCRVPVAADLVMMVSGIMGGSRTLLSALLLVLFPLMLVALVLRETLGEELVTGSGAALFNTLPKACFTTFLCLVVEDCADSKGRPIFLLVADAYGWSYSAFYSFTFVLLKFGLYNVIISIFVEQTVEAAKYNATYQKRARLNDRNMFKEKSLEMAELAYALHKGVPHEEVVCSELTMEEMQRLELTKDEFHRLCDDAEFQELLTELDVAKEDHLDLFDTLDVDGDGTLDLGELVSGIAKLRGDARKSDIVTVILLARHLVRSFTEFKKETTKELERQKRQLSSIQNVLQPSSKSQRTRNT